MIVDRYMVNLFFEIKRNIPLQLQKNLKISATNLESDMVALYNSCDDTNIQLLIEVFLERGGCKLPENFMTDKKTKNNASKPEDVKSTKRKKTKMIYRGQEVYK